jgi:hypothetical protein
MADTTTETKPKRTRGMSLRPRESDAPNPERICKRAEALLRKRANVDNLQQELADYIIPRKAVITEQRSEGEELTERVWRAVPIRANELLAARMQGALTSPSVRWFSLKTRDDEINSLYAVRQWLNKVEDILYLALRQSNFNQEIGEVYLDLGAFGIGAMLMEENPKEAPGFNGFLDVALAPGTYAVAEAATGEVNTLYRFVTMTVAQCAEQFGADALPESWREQLLLEPDADKELIHAIEPRKVTNPKRKDALHRPWTSVWLARQEKTILAESGYHEFPAIVPRWSKTTGEVYGRGPGHTALPDIRTLNRVWELGLQAASKALDPPGLTSSDAGIVELDQRPGMQNTVDGDPAKAWVPLESGAKFEVGNLMKQDLENEIRNTFYWDQLQLSSDKQMTLGEVQRRLEIMQQFLAPVLSRLESEGLAPCLNRKFNLMWRAGAFPPPPPELQGQELDIEYEGPLARSQKATRLAGFQEFTALTEPMVARNPAVADNLNDDKTYRDLGEIAGLPADYFRDERERDGMRQQRAQQEQVQQKMAVAQQAAEMGGKLAPMIKAGQGAPGGGGAPEGMDIEAMLAEVTGGQGGPPA